MEEINKVDGGLAAWKGKIFFFGESQAMVNSLLPAIPVYQMPVCELIVGWLKELMVLVKQFSGKKRKKLQGFLVSLNKEQYAKLLSH